MSVFKVMKIGMVLIRVMGVIRIVALDPDCAIWNADDSVRFPMNNIVALESDNTLHYRLAEFIGAPNIGGFYSRYKLYSCQSIRKYK